MEFKQILHLLQCLISLWSFQSFEISNTQFHYISWISSSFNYANIQSCRCSMFNLFLYIPHGILLRESSVTSNNIIWYKQNSLQQSHQIELQNIRQASIVMHGITITIQTKRIDNVIEFQLTILCIMYLLRAWIDINIWF